jgi:hypothetical protein
MRVVDLALAPRCFRRHKAYSEKCPARRMYLSPGKTGGRDLIDLL